MLLKITEKNTRENTFEQKKKKPGLNLTLGYALIGLRTTEPRAKMYSALSFDRINFFNMANLFSLSR